MDTTPDAPATTDFRNCALPALAAASPALAARYAIRARRTCPNIELSPLHCPRCGHLALSTRLQRQRKSTSSRVHRTNKGKDKRPHPQQHPPHSHYTSIRRTCAACGFTAAEAVAVAGDPVRASLKANFPKTASTRANARSAQAFPSGQELDVVQRPSDKVAEAPSVKVSFAPEMKATVQSTPNTPQASAGSAPRAVPSLELQKGTKPVLSSASLSSKRAKKKSGLQEMLARSREQKSKKEDGTPGSGLAAFLSGL